MLEYRAPRPVDMPGVRDDVARKFTRRRLARALRAVAERYGRMDMNLPMPMAAYRDWATRGIDDYVDMVERHVLAAEMFVVSDTMTDVAIHSAKTLPAFQVHPEDLPAPGGFVVFAKPVYAWDGKGVKVHVVAMSWGPATAQPLSQRAPEPGVWVVFWGSASLLGKSVARVGHFIYHDEVFIPWGRPQDVSYHDHAGMSTMLATWLLMGQRIAETRDEPLPRNLTRRHQQAGRAAPKVRVVQLRRPTARSAAPGEGSRTYSHQWLVRGFWRNQWYPSEGRHKPKLIEPYVKGPEGAPLIVSPRVNVLRR